MKLLQEPTRTNNRTIQSTIPCGIETDEAPSGTLSSRKKGSCMVQGIHWMRNEAVKWKQGLMQYCRAIRVPERISQEKTTGGSAYSGWKRKESLYPMSDPGIVFFLYRMLTLGGTLCNTPDGVNPGVWGSVKTDSL